VEFAAGKLTQRMHSLK